MSSDLSDLVDLAIHIPNLSDHWRFCLLFVSLAGLGLPLGIAVGGGCGWLIAIGAALAGVAGGLLWQARHVPGPV